jgi:hypothetical protein
MDAQTLCLHALTLATLVTCPMALTQLQQTAAHWPDMLQLEPAGVIPFSVVFGSSQLVRISALVSEKSVIMLELLLPQEKSKKAIGAKAFTFIGGNLLAPST